MTLDRRGADAVEARPRLRAAFAALQARSTAAPTAFKARMASARGALLRARTNPLGDLPGAAGKRVPGAVGPFLAALAALSQRQAALLAELEAQDEAGLNPPITVKPTPSPRPDGGSRDTLIDDFFRRFHAELRTAGEREKADALRAIADRIPRRRTEAGTGAAQRVAAGSCSRASGTRRGGPSACAPPMCSSWAGSPL